MSYVLINHAPDGTHFSVHGTRTAAINALARMLGVKHDPKGLDPELPCLRTNHRYVSDYGNVLIIEERPKGWTATKEERLKDAYDARECGIATKRQLAFLERLHF